MIISLIFHIPCVRRREKCRNVTVGKRKNKIFIPTEKYAFHRSLESNKDQKIFPFLLFIYLFINLFIYLFWLLQIQTTLLITDYSLPKAVLCIQ